MMKFAGSLVVAAALAGCAAGSGTNPFSTESTEEIEEKAANSTIPEELANNLSAASYSEAGGTPVLQVYIPHDGGPAIATYVRNASLDVGPYRAFTRQDTNLTRHFTGFGKISDDPDASVLAVVVGDGGQFGSFFAGGMYERSTDLVAPESGEFSYAGRYVAVTNLNGDSVVLGGTIPDGLEPEQSARLEGTILINANFNEGTVNGAITDRAFTDYPTYTGIPTLDLDEAEIDSNGEFMSTTSVDNQVKGNWGGIFGGDGATGIAGVVQAKEWGGSTSLTNEEEYGIFVLTRCGVAGDDALCDER